MRKQWVLVWIALVAVTAGFLTAPGVAVRAQEGNALHPVGVFEQVPCFVPLPDGVVDGQDVVCGYVTVPLYHAQPQGDTLRLAVAVVKAVGDSAAPDPLVIENGGPGFPSIISAPGMVGLTMFRESRDMIFIDQRGTGYSEPNLACESGMTLLRETYGLFPDDADALALEEAVQRECYRGWTSQGIDLSAFNSLENAADIPLVIRALGYDTYNFYGISYSSGLAQHIMRDHPERLRSVVLDGVTPVDESFTAHVAQSAQRAFDLIFDRCAANPICAAANPDLGATFYDLVAQYTAEPQTYQFDNPFNGGKVEGIVSGESLVMALYQQIYNAGADPLLPASITALAHGDPYFVQHYVAPSRFGSMRAASGMSNSVMCSEFAGYDLEVDGVHPALVEAMGWHMDYSPVCAIWQVERLPASARQPVESAIPTLLLSGEFDPVTPPANAEHVAAGLANAFAYTFPGVGHGSMGSSMCGFQIVLDFVDDPSQPPDTTCLDELGVRFMDALPSADTIMLAPVVLDDFGLRVPVPDLWTQQQPGVFLAPGQTSFAVIMPDTSFESALAGLSNPKPTGSIEAGARVWTIYGAEFQGYIGTVAITVADGPDDSAGVYFVGLFSSTAEELNVLTGSVLLDMLDGFAVATE